MVGVTELDRRPSGTGTALALVAALVAVGGLAASPPAVLAGVSGAGVLGAGLRYGSDAGVTAGAALLFVGVLVAGVFGAAPELLLVAASGTVVSWDVAENAVGVAQQLGREADTARAELVHAAGSAAVAALGSGVAYLAFTQVGGGHAESALVFLLLGAVLLAAALR